MPESCQTPWMHRRWSFDRPTELYPVVLSRLRGMPARAEQACRELDRAHAIAKQNGAWSIHQHLGHLIDLEELFVVRLDAYEAGADTLPAADMTNARSNTADRDTQPMSELLAGVRGARAATLDRVSKYPRDFFGRSAWHDRLGIHKRVVDTCEFFADHDDHHLAKIEHRIAEMA